MSRENLFAYTGPTGRGYPAYVSINRLEGGDVEVTVRGGPVEIVETPDLPAHLREGPTVAAVVPAAEWAKLTETHNAS